MASPDGRFLAWAVPRVYGGSRIRLYDIAAQRIIDRIRNVPGHRGGIPAGWQDAPDVRRRLRVRLWDVESGKERRWFEVVPPKSGGTPPMASGGAMPYYTPRRAALSPDGKTLAIGLVFRRAPKRGSRRARPPLGRGDR